MESDEQLYERVKRGDMGAFDALYERYERRLFRFVLRVLDDRGEAEEVFHDAFLKVFEGHASFRDARFASWLFRIARNACANRLRTRSRSAVALARMPAERPAPDPEELLARGERAWKLNGAVDRLPSNLAEVFHLRNAGLSYEEIAGALEIPIGTVKSRLNALVQHLKTELQQ